MGLLDTVKTVLGISPFSPVDTSKVFGIDLSHWSGVCDLKKAKDYGVSFVILKAMDGVNPTRYFKENYKQAIDAGLLVGSYQWLYKTISQDSQAKAYYNLVKDYPCQITETVDFETTASGNSTFNELYNMMVRLEDLTQRKAMVYTGVSYWNVNGSQNSSFFAQRDLWLANYKVSTPTLIKPWGENWKIWQYTDRAQGSLMGVSGESMVDCNYFNGSKEELYKWCGVSNPNIPPVDPPIIIDPPVDPIVPPIGKPATVVATSVNVRFDAGITFPTVTSPIFKGAVVNILEEKKDIAGNTWGKIGTGKWIAMLYYNLVYVKYNGVTPPTPTPPFSSATKLNYVLPRFVNGGPSIIAGSDAPKQNHPNFLMDNFWQLYVKNLNENDSKRYGLWIAPNIGPTKGLNNNNKAIYIPAVWSFNVVEVTGNVSNEWTEINCINMVKGIPDFILINHEKTPQLVNRMTTTDKNNNYMSFPLQNGKTSAWELVNDPIASPDGKMWIPAIYLLDLCTITIPSLNVRDIPSTSGKVIGGMINNSKTNIYSIKKDSSGNTWGMIGENRWICMVNQGTYYTNWKLR